jgi:hypothetical protein
MINAHKQRMMSGGGHDLVARLDRIEQKVVRSDEKVTRIEHKAERIDNRAERVEQRLALLVTTLEDRLTRLERSIGGRGPGLAPPDSAADA